MNPRNRFHKGHALGNDYLVVEASALDIPLDAAVVRALCHRHLGPGADGVVALDGGKATVWNADGTVAEVSGNGLRIAALVRAPRGAAGVRRVLRSGGRDYPITIDGSTVSIELPAPTVGVLRCPLEVAGQRIEVTEVNVGNPHAVLEASRLAPLGFDAVAPLLASLDRWPEGRNVEAVACVGPSRLLLQLHERGVGPTEASGTGACAAVAAALALGLVEGPRVEALMPGGVAEVTITDDGLTLRGPVTRVCEGEIDPEWLRSLRGAGAGAR